jgi:filamentous hemagglutinin family protein
MKASTLQFGLINGSIALSFVLASIRVGAQITPDNTLPSNSVVTEENNITVIKEGTVNEENTNLFHSFQEFSIESGNTARFEHNPNIDNIITRVRGAASNINGTIQTRINGSTDPGSANLFIINPNGIIFGENASLDIGGSFIGSTADSINFADGTKFSVADAQNSALLTVSVPLGLQFGSNPGDILNSPQVSSNGSFQVPNGKTLALVGGNLSLEGSNLILTEGRIDLGSVGANSFVDINKNEIETNYELGYTGVENFGDITLKTAIVVNSGEGGNAIQVQGKNINLLEGSVIFSSVTGSTPGKNLVINASESLTLSGVSQILATTQAQGRGGDVRIETSSLTLSGGANIGTFTQNDGEAGDVIVEASDFIELEGISSENNSPTTPTSIIAQVLQESTGNGGDIQIKTRQLSIKGGAIIDASTFGRGNAGNVEVVEADSIKLVGRTPDFNNPSGIFAQVAEGASGNTGNAGTLNIETRQLIIEAGAQISSAGRKNGNGGNVNINASDSLTLTGSSPTATLRSGSSGIFATAEGEGATGNPGSLDIKTKLLTVENGGKVSANNRSTGQQPGNLTLNVDNLLIRDGGLVQAGTFNTGPGGNLTVNAKNSVEVSGSANNILGEDIVNSTITVSSEGTGVGGNLEVNADRIELSNQGELKSESQANADAGNITLNLNESLFLRRGSQISTSAGTAQAPGNGGNIFINTPSGFIVGVPKENSDITANAFTGAGGNIAINSQGIFGIESRSEQTLQSDITASSELGVPGNINVITPDNNGIQNSLIELAENPIDSETLVASTCVVRSNERNGSFIITGKGGLSYSPGNPVSSVYSAVEVQPVPNNTSSTKPNPRWKIGQPIVEPSGIYRLANGRRILSRECGK